MQIDDLLVPDKPSKINDSCLQQVIEWERCLDLMEFVRVPKPESLVDIQRVHDLWILKVLHIVYKLYHLVFLLLLIFS